MKVEALAEYKRLTTANLLIEADKKTRQINWSSGIWYKKVDANDLNAQETILIGKTTKNIEDPDYAFLRLADKVNNTQKD